jgi:hypothetical protein
MQSRLNSFLEQTVNLVIGMAVSVAATFIIFPLFGYEVNLLTNLGITACYTVISFARGYLVRRVFNKLELFGSK